MSCALLHDDEISLFSLCPEAFPVQETMDAIVNDSVKMDDVTDSMKLPSQAPSGGSDELWVLDLCARPGGQVSMSIAECPPKVQKGRVFPPVFAAVATHS